MYSAQFTIDRIQALIRKSGKSQKTVLAECGISENTLVRMTDKKGMSSFNLGLIADNLGCSVDYLLGRTDTPDNSPAAITVGDNTRINNIVNSSNFNISEYNSDDITLLHLIQKMPLIERAKLICELNDKYNVEK